MLFIITWGYLIPLVICLVVGLTGRLVDKQNAQFWEDACVFSIVPFINVAVIGSVILEAVL